jgi:uncharacterized protein YjaG (DUF416 family)
MVTAEATLYFLQLHQQAAAVVVAVKAVQDLAVVQEVALQAELLKQVVQEQRVKVIMVAMVAVTQAAEAVVQEARVVRVMEQDKRVLRVVVLIHL